MSLRLLVLLLLFPLSPTLFPVAPVVSLNCFTKILSDEAMKTAALKGTIAEPIVGRCCSWVNTHLLISKTLTSKKTNTKKINLCNIHKSTESSLKIIMSGLDLRLNLNSRLPSKIYTLHYTKMKHNCNTK